MIIWRVLILKNNPTNEKVIIGVVIYNPTELDKKKLRDLFQTNFHFLIVDNSTSKSKFIDHKEDNITLLSNGVNIGLSKAYNLFLNSAKQLNFTYLLILDQDSDFNVNSIERMLLGFSFKLNNMKVGLVAPRIVYDHKKNTLNKKNVIKKDDFENVNWVISSGSLLDVDIALFVGGFDETYFIDRVDADFCAILRRQSFNILVCNRVKMTQFLGETIGNGLFQHSRIRHYYRSRNRFYYNFKHMSFVKACFFSFLGFFKQIISLMMYEKNALKKIRFTILGIIDYTANYGGKKD